MTPEELKQIAIEATKKEYEEIVEKMKSSAKQGSFSCKFATLSEKVMEQLKNAGFDVQEKTDETKPRRLF